MTLNRKGGIGMQNLAGNRGCDSVIRGELSQSGVTIVPAPENRGEVPASIKGVLNKGSDIVFTFVRAWYYWMVAGNVSLEVARIMYENPIGAKDVRVAGHCGCPPPEEWARPASGQRFVDNYHIDSQEGLDLFVATMKEHGLID